MYLTITIDTEEDQWGEYDRSFYTVENIARIPSLQRMFEARGIRPTYLISYPVAADPNAMGLLRGYDEQGLCEVGTHPHPWNTPPVEEPRTAYNSYLSHLPRSLQFRKLETLHATIARNLGRVPTSYRSGRWSFSDDVARNLVRLGYKVDTTLSPRSDWRTYGGPDYSNETHEPFTYVVEPSPDEAGGSLLEVPATIGYVQSSPRADGIYRGIERHVPRAQKVLRALDLVRVLNHACLSPETHDADRMIRLAKALLHRGTKVLNLFFHSPTLLPGCSPFTRTEADGRRFVAHIERFLDFAAAAGLRSVTMSELGAADLGAMGTRTVAAPVDRRVASQPSHDEPAIRVRLQTSGH